MDITKEINERNLSWLEPYKVTVKRFNDPYSEGTVLIRSALYGSDVEMLGVTPRRYIVIHTDKDGFQWVKAVNKDGSLGKTAYCITADFGRKYNKDSVINMVSAIHDWSIEQIANYIKEIYSGKKK